ncbi:MAG: single-stranded DNA-binding protein [bacterium]|nr:single-stranded DNA-binding protein [bacterium]
MDLNKVMIIGRLTRDPEMRSIPSGDSVANFGVATNRVWTNNQGQKQEKVEFHNIVAWRKLAEICGQYLKKGDRVYVEGSLQTHDWQGQDGIKRYRTEIVARDLIMLSSRRSEQGSAYPVSPQQQTNTAAPAKVTAAPDQEMPVINIEEEMKNETAESETPVSAKTPNPDDEGISIEDIPF